MTSPTAQRGTVINSLMDGSGRALQNVTVRIRLIAPGNPFLANGIGEVLAEHAVDTDHDGQWSATLLLNSEYDQENTYYLADERCAPSGTQWPFRITSTDTRWLHDLLIPVPPPGVNPPWELKLNDLADVDVQTAIPGDLLGLGPAGQWVPQRYPQLAIKKTFSTPQAVWEFAHGLGRRPWPRTWGLDGTHFQGQVTWPDDNTVRVEYRHPRTGTMEV